MPTFDQINEFRPESESFSVYLERFELFVLANSIPDSKKVPLFLTVLGGNTYGLLHNLMAPDNPRDKSFETITGVLKAHFEPKPPIIAHFHRRDQAQGESVAEYLAELRRLASKCNFGAYLDEALRDRLVCGQRSEAIQKRLLSEPEPTLARVLEITQGMEAAHKQAQMLKTSDTVTVGKVDRRAPPQQGAVVRGKPCYRCGKIGHAQQNCGFREATCHACGKKGHISRVCKSSRGQIKPLL